MSDVTDAVAGLVAPNYGLKTNNTERGSFVYSNAAGASTNAVTGHVEIYVPVDSYVALAATAVSATNGSFVRAGDQKYIGYASAANVRAIRVSGTTNATAYFTVIDKATGS